MKSIPRVPVKRKNVKRRKSEFARAYGSKERVEWVASQGCVVCGRTPCDNAHIVTGGMGRKADYTEIVPLCKNGWRPDRGLGHHWQLHARGRPDFESLYSIDLDRAAQSTQQAWLDHQAGDK